MALSITFRKNDKESTLSVYVGQNTNWADVAIVASVQADGDELEHIQDVFSNLPARSGRRVQSWFGDDAKFIVANW